MKPTFLLAIGALLLQAAACRTGGPDTLFPNSAPTLHSGNTSSPGLPTVETSAQSAPATAEGARRAVMRMLDKQALKPDSEYLNADTIIVVSRFQASDEVRGDTVLVLLKAMTIGQLIREPGADGRKRRLVRGYAMRQQSYRVVTHNSGADVVAMETAKPIALVQFLAQGMDHFIVPPAERAWLAQMAETEMNLRGR